MNIDEAIEILSELPDNLNNVLDYDQQNALKLGIEALKAISDIRRYHYLYTAIALPGETEE